jgi:hypothetical protein
VSPFSQCADFFTANWFDSVKGLWPQVANRDVFMLCLIHKAAAELVIGHLKIASTTLFAFFVMIDLL